MPQVVIALGSNVGDRHAHLQAAVDELGRHLEIVTVAPIYETAPMYVEDQPAFFNSALVARSALSPLALLAALKGAEEELGRRSGSGRRYGPREIDIDLIAYGALRYRFGDVLEVPHHRLAERRFVLQPLFDLLPTGSLPGLGSIADLLDRTNCQASSVHKVEDAVLSIHRH